MYAADHRRRARVLACAALLAGCGGAVARRAPPPGDVPTGWSGPVEVGERDAPALAEWWRAFGDPTLDRLVADALAADVDLATARARVREARARRDLARAGGRPSLGASASAGHSDSSEPAPAGDARQTYSVGLDASWEPDLFGARRAEVDAATADVHASVEALRGVRVALVAEVARSYVDLRAGASRLGLAVRGLEARRETAALAGWRYEAGLVSELDVARARVAVETAEAALPALRVAVAEAGNRLSVLLGRPPGAVEVPAGDRIPVVEAPLAAGVPADTLRARPDVRLAERALAGSIARLDAAEAARYPSLRLSGSIALQAVVSGGATAAGAVWSLLGGLTAPILDGGRIAATVGIQHAQVEQARLAYRGAVLAALEDVEGALLAVQAADTRLARLGEALAAAGTTWTLAEQRYESGLVDFLVVLDAQQTALDLEDQRASTAAELARARIRLFAALGGGWAPTDTDEVDR